jgi:glycerol transport system ATP-binding protein
MSLALENVSKIVAGETHIADVSLRFQPGSLNVLLGPTLSGKTTLMRLMAGLEPPSQGRVLIDDKDVTGVPVRKRDVAMVYQQFINYPTLTVFENIASPLRVARRGRDEIERRVHEAAHLLKLENLLERTPLELSGGQQQRTAIARALVKDASLVLLDEPLANLDFKLREELREELPKIFAAHGTILVYATTEPTEALLLGGNTATLHQGRVTQFGPTIQVYRHPADRTTAEVFSDPPMNFLEAHAERGVITLPGDISMPAREGVGDGPVTLGFRPSRLYLERPSPKAVALPSSVAVVEITGSESLVHIRYRDHAWVALAHGVRQIAPGSAVEVFLDPERLFVFDQSGQLVAAPLRAEAA